MHYWSGASMLHKKALQLMLLGEANIVNYMI